MPIDKTPVWTSLVVEKKIELSFIKPMMRRREKLVTSNIKRKKGPHEIAIEPNSVVKEVTQLFLIKRKMR